MFRPHSHAEQVTDHLRKGLQSGRWSEYMPGRDRLARELGVHGSTVVRALQMLEQEGLIKSQGRGKRRKITIANHQARAGMQVLIICYEPEDVGNFYIVELGHLLRAAGHSPVIAPQSLRELKHSPKKVMAMIQKHPVDACIIMAGARAVLEKVVGIETPVFALFGRMSGLPLSGTGYDKLPALRQAIQWLCKSGHRRIVMLMRAEHVKTTLGIIEQTFLDELKMHGLPCSSYNLPVWQNSTERLHACLDGLFKITPPDAILVDDWSLFYIVQNYLAHQRGQHFREVQCVCMDYHPSFKWCRPQPAYYEWEPKSVVRRTVRWVDRVAQGKVAKSQQLIKAKFVKGGK